MTMGVFISGMKMPTEEEIGKCIIVRHDGEVWNVEFDNLVDGGFVACYPTNPMRAVSVPPHVRPVVRGHKVTHNRPIAGYWASGKLDGGWDGMEGRVWVKPIMDNPVDYCSECGKRLDDTFQNFCPNCGADMREE